MSQVHLTLRRLSIPLALALSVSVCVSVARAADTVNVLVLDGLKIDARLSGELEREGIHFTYGDLQQPISEEMLRQFHVVMINQAHHISINFQNPGPYFTAKENIARLLRYAESGGGLYLGVPVPGLSTVLGVESRELAVRDDANMWSEAIEGTSLRTEYARTTEIAAHEVTDGVSGISYPVQQGRWDDMYATHTFTWSEEWVPLVSSMQTGTVSRGYFAAEWEVIDRLPSPLVAVRGVGQGRAAFVTVNPLYTFLHPYEPPSVSTLGEFFVGRIDGVFMEKGDGETPSQGRVLLTNLLRWLGAAADAHGLGAYSAEAYEQLPKPAPAAVPSWIGEHGWMGWSETRGGTWRQVLIGARTAYSDGSGTVADYAAEARKQGITVLAITETMEKFDPANWSKFKEDCREASDDTLKVVHGLDLADEYGNRFLVLNNDAFPPSAMTKAGGRIMAATYYLSIRMGSESLIIAHRLTTSPLVHQLLKHYQGISVYTYRNGALEDNSYPAYEWQAFRYSNPMPFAVHETYAPEDLARSATTGHQVYVYTGTAEEAAWYLVGSHGLSHFWETPTKLQVSDGPRLLAFNDQPFLKVVSDVPITEVRLMENYNLYRRWTPQTTEFIVDSVPMPKKHWAWYLVVATDANGRTVVSPPVCAGQAGSFAWRCADRQNWLQGGPNIYPGWLATDFNIAVPTFGTDEGKPSYYGYPNMSGPQRGDNMCPLLDFPVTGPAVQVQDVYIDERYYRATWEDVAGDARPAHVTSRSRVYAAKLRYLQFFEEQQELPRMRSLTLRLRRPVDATTAGEVFPVFTGLRSEWVDSPGNPSYAFVDPQSGEMVKGTLTQGFVDLPRGGRVGGFIAMSDEIRVAADGRVGFAPRRTGGGALPVDTVWEAQFTTVPPTEAEEWRERMGFAGETPFKLTFTQGDLTQLAYLAHCQAREGGVAGSVAQAMTEAYRLPVRVGGVSYNWEAGLWRPDQGWEPVDVFEGAAWARLDVTRAGDFYLGNLVMAGDPALRLQVLEWSPTVLRLDLHNPTDHAIECEIWTAAAVKDHRQVRSQVSVPPGTSQRMEWQPD